MKNRFYKVHTQGIVVSSIPGQSYTLRVGNTDYEVEFTQMHASNIRYPENLLADDGCSLSVGASVQLVGICRSGLDISWRPSHEDYLECIPANENEIEDEARKRYFQILKKGTEKGQIPERLCESIVSLAQGSALKALIQLKMFLGIPINL